MKFSFETKAPPKKGASSGHFSESPPEPNSCKSDVSEDEKGALGAFSPYIREEINSNSEESENKKNSLGTSEGKGGLKAPKPPPDFHPGIDHASRAFLAFVAKQFPGNAAAIRAAHAVIADAAAEIARLCDQPTQTQAWAARAVANIALRLASSDELISVARALDADLK